MWEFFPSKGEPRLVPGKHNGKARGPRALLCPGKRTCIARSALAEKAHGEDPCVEEPILRCLVAASNPIFKRPCYDKIIQKVFQEDCYDFDPDYPWRYQSPLRKRFSPDHVKAHRCDMASHLLKQDRLPASWFNNVVWIDHCAAILPGSRLQYERTKQAATRNKRYISDDAKMYSRNVRAPPSAVKQNTEGGQKVCWLMV